MDKTKKIFLLSNIVLVGFFIAIMFHYLCECFHIGWGIACNTFLLTPEWKLGDFSWIMHYVKDFAPFTIPNKWINYFPPAYLLMYPFSFIKNVPLGYSLFLSIFLGFFIYLNIKFFSCKNLTPLENFQNIFILTAITYPFLFLAERGNLDMMIFLLFAAVVYLFKFKKYLPSAILLAVITAMKPFSFIFWGLFFFKEKWKELFLSVFLTVALILFGFFIYKGGFFNNIAVFQKDLAIYQKIFVYDPKCCGAVNGSSLFLALKLILCSNYHLISTSLLVKLCDSINLFITVFTLIFAWNEKVFWKKICLLTLCMLIVPYITFDYKLIFLFVPIWLFVNTKRKSRFDIVYTILFGLLLIPKKFILIHHQLVVFSAVLNPILILGFMSLIIYERLKLRSMEKIKDEQSE